MDLFWEREGLRFACTQCSHCCRHESGYVFLSAIDLELIADYLDITGQDVINRYCIQVPTGAVATISLAEKENKDCIFWDDGGCSIYAARPVQCRTYPFWRTVVSDAVAWEREGRSCPGIGVGPVRSPREIRSAINKRQANVPLVIQNMQERP